VHMFYLLSSILFVRSAIKLSSTRPGYVFQYIIPDSGERITATKTNEHSELFWASCGGGGGNYALATQFEFAMMPACVHGSNSASPCGVIKLQYLVPQTLEIIRFYQEWSLKIDPRITANLELENSTHAAVTGIWMGTMEAFEVALIASGLTESTPLSVSGMLAAASGTTFAQALTDLSGWTDDMSAGVLVGTFLQERTYFKVCLNPSRLPFNIYAASSSSLLSPLLEHSSPRRLIPFPNTLR